MSESIRNGLMFIGAAAVLYWVRRAMEREETGYYAGRELQYDP